MSHTTIRATLTLLTGYTYTLTPDDILAFSLQEGVSGGDMLLGGALSAHGSLTLASPDGAWLPGGSMLRTRTLSGATASIEISTDGNAYRPFSRFIVSAIDADEGEDAVTLSGYDDMAHALSAPFADTLSYPQPLTAVLDHIASQSGLTCALTPACNASLSVKKRPAWGKNCTLRQALSWCAALAGCFARVTPQGTLTLCPMRGSNTSALAAGDMFTLSLSTAPFVFNRIRLQPYEEKGDAADAYVDSTLPALASNTLEISANPLLSDSVINRASAANALATALSGLTLTPFTAEMPADTLYAVGDALSITDLRGAVHKSMVFARRLTLRQEATLHLSCDPDTSGVSLPRVISSSGILSGSALHDGIIASNHIAAGAIDAESIAARAITADKIALGTITSDSGVIGDLSADNITAGKLTTDRLIVGGEEFSIVRALNQLYDAISQNDDSIDGGVLTDGTISARKVTEDFGTGLEISSNTAILLLAGKLDGTHSHLQLSENAINMVGGEINIATDDMQIRGMQDGNEIMSLDPDGLSADRVIVRKEFFAPNAVLKHLDSAVPWKGSIQASIDACPKYLNVNATLTIPAGFYEEDVEICGFIGRRLTIKFSPGAYLNGYMEVNNCAHVVVRADALGDGYIYPRSAEDAALRFYGVPRVQVSNMHISGYRGRTSSSDGSDIALYFNSCHALVENCCLEYANKGLSCNYSIVFANGNIGGTTGANAATNANLKQGILASSGSHVHLVGTYPMGGTAGYSTYRGVINTYDLGDATAGGMTEPGATWVTRTFTPSKHCTYVYGVERVRDTQVSSISQGRYGDYAASSLGWRIGCLWFNDALEQLGGKTIRQATLTLRRSSGGFSSSAVPVYLGTVDLAEGDYATTLTPVFTKSTTLPDYPAGTLNRETEGTFDVTNLMTAFLQGDALALSEARSSYEGTWSPAYTNFYGKGSAYEPVLTVEYK